MQVKVITGRTSAARAGPVQDASIAPLYFDVTAPAGASFAEAVDAGGLGHGRGLSRAP